MERPKKKIHKRLALLVLLVKFNIPIQAFLHQFPLFRSANSVMFQHKKQNRSRLFTEGKEYDELSYDTSPSSVTVLSSSLSTPDVIDKTINNDIAPSTSESNLVVTLNDEEDCDPVSGYDMATDPRYAASAWLEILRTLPSSSVLRSTKRPVLSVFLWSLLWSMLLHIYTPLQSFHLPTLPHAVTIPVVSLLLVFRTNSAYQRFAEGRLIWEHILSVSRNLTRMVTLYRDNFDIVRRQRIEGLLAAFPYLLHQHVMSVQDQSSMYVLDHGNNQRAVPWNFLPCEATVQLCAAANNRPLWICDRLSQEVERIPYTENYTNREREKFINLITRLSECIGECERIHLTSVPIHYARHSLRALTLWLFTLPLLLLQSYDWWEAAICQVITAWILYGIYQIGHSVEVPFQGTLRLSTICDEIYRNVRLDQRFSAFQVRLGEKDQEWNDLPL